MYEGDGAGATRQVERTARVGGVERGKGDELPGCMVRGWGAASYGVSPRSSPNLLEQLLTTSLHHIWHRQVQDPGGLESRGSAGVAVEGSRGLKAA